MMNLNRLVDKCIKKLDANDSMKIFRDKLGIPMAPLTDLKV